MTERVVHLQTQTQNIHQQWARPAALTGLVAAGFLIAVVLIMGDSHLQERRSNPLTLGQIASLKKELVNQPANDAIKQQIRQLDLDVRQRYFHRRSLAARGAWLLLAGSLVLLVAIKTSLILTAQPYLPNPEVNPVHQQRHAALLVRRQIFAAGCVLAGALIAVAAMPASRLPSFSLATGPGAATTNPAPAANATPVTPDQLAKNWPAFRGPHGTGVAAPAEYPIRWDAASGDNVLWKAQVELPGHSSPIVWEDKVFLTGAAPEKRELYCFDAATGQLKWKQPVGQTGNPGLDLGEASGGYAPNTPATDGQRVYALFPTGDVAAFDLAGKKIWAKNLGLPKNPYGHATSLLVWNGLLIVQYDQGNTATDGNSSVMALDAATGNLVWQTKRQMMASWATPIIIQTGNDYQLVCNGMPYVIAYDPKNGNEIWRVKCMDGEVAPSPVFAAGLVLVCNERAELAAIKPDGKGDVTATHIAWKMDENLPDIVSPVSNGELVWMIKTSGLLTCVDLKDGKVVYEFDFADKETLEVKASPVIVQNRIYLLDLAGVTHVLDTGRQFKQLSTGTVGEECNASPAFAHGKIYIRGAEHLYCIGKK